MGSRTDRAKSVSARVLTDDGNTPYVRIEFTMANEALISLLSNM